MPATVYVLHFHKVYRDKVKHMIAITLLPSMELTLQELPAHSPLFAAMQREIPDFGFQVADTWELPDVDTARMFRHSLIRNQKPKHVCSICNPGHHRGDGQRRRLERMKSVRPNTKRKAAV